MSLSNRPSTIHLSCIYFVAEPYHVCKLCWDKVKNSTTGCRVWIHARMEQAHPGIIHENRIAFKVQGTNGPAYIAFEQYFLELLEQCLLMHDPHIHAENNHDPSSVKRMKKDPHILDRLPRFTFIALDGMRYTQSQPKSDNA